MRERQREGGIINFGYCDRAQCSLSRCEEGKRGGEERTGSEDVGGGRRGGEGEKQSKSNDNAWKR